MDQNYEDAIAELDDPLGQGEPDDDEVAVVPLREEPLYRIPSGKYKGVELPRMVGVKPSYYAKVMELKEQIILDPEFQRQAGTIARTYAELRREAEQKARELSDVKLRLTAVMLLMIDQFEVESESGLTLASGDKIHWRAEPHLVVTDKEQFRQWCVAQHLEREMVLPWGKGNKLLKDMILAGDDVPDGAEMFARPKVTFTKGNK